MNSDTDIIAHLFGGAGRTAILRLLASETTPLTGRQIADMTGLSPAGASRALEHLAGLGVVTRRSVGRAFVHELDRGSDIVRQLILPAIEAEEKIAAARRARPVGGLPPEVIECLVDGFSPLKVVLFGSRARGEADESADFDLLVVVPEVADRHSLAVGMLVALGHLGVPVDIVPTDPAELEERGDVPGSLLRRALEEGLVVYERSAA